MSDEGNWVRAALAASLIGEKDWKKHAEVHAQIEALRNQEEMIECLRRAQETPEERAARHEREKQDRADRAAFAEKQAAEAERQAKKQATLRRIFDEQRRKHPSLFAFHTLTFWAGLVCLGGSVWGWMNGGSGLLMLVGGVALFVQHFVLGGSVKDILSRAEHAADPDNQMASIK